jgi:MFS family permease
VGAVGTVGGTLLLGLAFNVGGPLLWACWVVGGIVAAVTVPALAVYGPELFPTALRGRANGIISTVGALGGGIGLILTGRLASAHHFGRIGTPLLLLAAGPILLAALVLARYPETAHRELEDLNPEDR